MHLADFLGLAGGHPGLQQQLAALPTLPPHSRHCLLSGPERCGKTALLFSLALSAARQGKSVLLLCRRCAAATDCLACMRQCGVHAPPLFAFTAADPCACNAPAFHAFHACRAKLEQGPPLLPEGVAVSDPAWQHVSIKYLTSGGCPGLQHNSAAQ
jgi:hypothetical protein